MKTIVAAGAVVAVLAIAAPPSLATDPIAAAGRAGDTVGIGLGWQQNLSRKNVSVTILPAAGGSITLGPDDPALRAVVNVYPDPVSRVLVSGVHLDRDWWETTVYFDLPATLSPGTAEVIVSGPEGPIAGGARLIEVLPGVGATLGSAAGVPSDGDGLTPFERAEHSTVTFTGSSVPHSIQVELSHAEAAGPLRVVNTPGDAKNVAWRDDGTTLRVLLTPADGRTPSALVQFKFYVAGDVTDLGVSSVKAYDVDGAPIAGIGASIQ